MLDENEPWRISGEDGRTVISGNWGSGGPVVRALCHDTETAQHIVKLHNDALGDCAHTRRVVVGTGPVLEIKRPTFSDPPVVLRYSTDDDPASIPSAIRIIDDAQAVADSALRDSSGVRGPSLG